MQVAFPSGQPTPSALQASRLELVDLPSRSSCSCDAISCRLDFSFRRLTGTRLNLTLSKLVVQFETGMAQMNVAWPTSRQPSTMWQPHAHGVHRFVRKTSWCAVGLSSNAGLGIDLDPSTGSAWPGSPVRLPCSSDSSAHKRCGPWTKYTVDLTVRLDGPSALTSDIDTGNHITPDISSHF